MSIYHNRINAISNLNGAKHVDGRKREHHNFSQEVFNWQVTVYFVYIRLEANILCL